jgi:acyl carrier protein
MRHQDAETLVHRAIDTINRQLPVERRLKKMPETVIIGPGGELDSLGIITLVIALEEMVSQAVGQPVQLLDETALASNNSPFQTIGSLTRFLEALPAS